MNKTNLKSSISTNQNFINHKGVVTKMTEESIIVSLVGNINCTSCHAKSACGVSDVDVKTIEVFENHTSFKLNESVKIVMGNNMGLKAVFFAYFFPFILLFSTLIMSLNYIKEWQAGLLSLFVLVPYYAIIYFSTKSFQKKFSISLLKLK